MRFLPLALLVFGGWSALAGARASDDELDDLLQEVRANPDRVLPKTLKGLAIRGDEESFDALVTAIGWIRDPDILGRAFRAFRFFREDPALAARAVSFLEDQALSAPRRETRTAAILPLVHFGEQSNAAYERIVRESKDAECRALAIAPLLDTLLARGDETALRLVLDNAVAADVARRPTPFAAFEADVVRPRLVEKLADDETSVGWRLFLIDALAEESGEELLAALRDLLRHRSSVLQLAAIRSLVAHGEAASARTQLERLRLSQDPHVKVEVVRILTELASEDPSWYEKLWALVRSSSDYDRIAAVAGFAVVADLASLEVLGELLQDRSWRVRDAVREAAEDLRRKELLQPLIGRLDRENGLMRWRFAGTLERLTGLAMGRNAKAWKNWYTLHGETFELPSVAELGAREASRDERATVARFFGVPVLSTAAIFVVDVSGSMLEPAAPDEEAGDETPTRLALAKRELNELLARLPEASRTNLLFFADEVRGWEPALRALDSGARTDAEEFVTAQEVGPGTNLYDALVAAFEDEHADTFYVLSDGDPTAGEVTDPIQIRAEVAQWNTVGRVTIHCISVGQPSDLLAALAADSDGIYVEVGVPGAGDRAK